MDDYKNVRDELRRGTPPEAICATCPWHRPCVMPPALGEDQLKRKIDEALEQDKTSGHKDGMPVAALLTTLALGGQTTAGEMCPVFALRISGPAGRHTADAIRALMRDQ